MPEQIEWSYPGWTPPFGAMAVQGRTVDDDTELIIIPYTAPRYWWLPSRTLTQDEMEGWHLGQLLSDLRAGTGGEYGVHGAMKSERPDFKLFGDEAKQTGVGIELASFAQPTRRAIERQMSNVWDGLRATPDRFAHLAGCHVFVVDTDVAGNRDVERLIRSPDGQAAPKCSDSIGMSPSVATWLCEGPLERTRMLELNRAVIGGTAVMYLIGLVALLAGGPVFGWWIVGVLVLGAAGGSVFRIFAARSVRPEYWLFAMFAYTQLLTGTGIFFTGGWNSPYLAWLAMVCVGLPSYFSRRGVIVGLVFTFVTLIVASAGPSVAGDLRLARVCSAACVVGVVTAVGYVMMRTELRYRGEAMLDPLTGLMNRRELTNRFAAVRQQAGEVAGPIALLAVDIDHFKDVNDRYGHDRGDAVLRELAGVMRASLRTHDEVYRIGGEEFLLVAGGASEEEACVLAERLRTAVENARPAGVRITVSVGVVSRPSDTGDANCDELMRVADAALYAAKNSGRNRVHAAA